ncbi:DUF4911 domain-containing protein [Pelobacter propionicus]|uniref:DUF4911 domain-containing protein n=1 Tax=Pelobacter propionicus (strain DSM 2379 / NBRC 103807 / OttBd1) TaxID=338966 RepID=A1ALM2_PELPD|nr:DUF4911 domain-containing protein [Pelobacter propionicus]ABK98242.1 hypothetical protein Ppro_0611 [Pelobacter propionicus DSM 2379]
MRACEGGNGRPAAEDGAPLCRYFRVNQRDIVLLKFILEAYEGMNVMSTVDNGAGIIRILIMPGFEQDMEGLLTDLSGQVVMEPVEWDGEGSW